MQVVSIELEGKDDPQVIFETLNARGEPLLPSDLLRNYIFRRAEKNKEDQDRLYEKYWKMFEEGFWRENETQGRLKRYRIDLFMQHFLSLKKATDINIGHLFEEYKNWIDSSIPYSSIEAELDDLTSYAGAFCQLIKPDVNTRFGQFAERLQVLDVRTIYPLALYLLTDSNLSENELDDIAIDLESYLIRRAVCGKTTKNYSKFFLQILRDLQASGVTREALQNLLLSPTGEAGIFPDDIEFERAWLEIPVYEMLGPKKVELILSVIEDNQRHQFAEEVKVLSNLTVEHFMPQNWENFWSLPTDVVDVTTNSIDLMARRDQLIQTFGNLTLLTQKLNSSVSNAAFSIKKDKINESSVLRLNRYFQNVDIWDEQAILIRGKQLFQIAKKVWSYPER